MHGVNYNGITERNSQIYRVKSYTQLPQRENGENRNEKENKQRKLQQPKSVWLARAVRERLWEISVFSLLCERERFSTFFDEV